MSAVQSLKLNPIFSCNYCGAGYTQEGYIKRHMESKHMDQKKSNNLENVSPECNECGKVFANHKTLEKHVKTHLKCNTCKEEFSSIEIEPFFAKLCQPQKYTYLYFISQALYVFTGQRAANNGLSNF